ncbi:MAG: hypothetical protein H0X27_03625 [Caulobacteraceae bacterium]|nr:hypothetical protein [Caulobacteraceae bacterium]
MFRPLIPAALWWTLAVPAVAAVGTPVLLGTNSATTGTTVTISTAAAVPTGDFILIASGSEGDGQLNACTDNGSPPNAYTIGAHVSPAGGEANLAWTAMPITLPLASGASIMCTWTGGTFLHLLGAVAIPGASAIDHEAGVTKGSSKNPTGTSGVMLNPTDELAFFELLGVNEGGDTGYIDDVLINPDFAFTSTSSTLRLGHEVPPSRAPALYGPQFGVSRKWGTKAIVFMSPPVAQPTRRISYASTGSLSAAPQYNNPITWGYQFPTTTGAYLQTVQDLPAGIFRIGMNTLEKSPGFYSATVGTIRDKNAKIIANIKNRVEADKISVPPTDQTTYTNLLNPFFTTFASDIGLVTVENEQDGPNDYREHGSCSSDSTLCPMVALDTTDDYIRQLGWAVLAAHAYGLKVANGGFSSSGVDLWYWFYLYNGGQQYAADQYALTAFSGSNDEGAKASDLPTAQDPSRQIFGSNIPAYLHMLQITDMVPRIKGTGADYVSVHSLNRGPYPGPKYKALQAIIQASGLPPVSDAVGIKSNDAPTTEGVVGIGPTFGMTVTSWFGAPERDDMSDHAYPIAKDDGTLNAFGKIYQAIIATYP